MSISSCSDRAAVGDRRVAIVGGRFDGDLKDSSGPGIVLKGRQDVVADGERTAKEVPVGQLGISGEVAGDAWWQWHGRFDQQHRAL